MKFYTRKSIHLSITAFVQMNFIPLIVGSSKNEMKIRVKYIYVDQIK